MGFLDTFIMCVFGWLICLGMTLEMVCDAGDCGWLKLSLFIGVLGVLVLGDGGAVGVGVGGVCECVEWGLVVCREWLVYL